MKPLILAVELPTAPLQLKNAKQARNLILRNNFSFVIENLELTLKWLKDLHNAPCIFLEEDVRHQHGRKCVPLVLSFDEYLDDDGTMTEF